MSLRCGALGQMELTPAEALGDGGSWTAAVAASAQHDDLPPVLPSAQELQLPHQPEAMQEPLPPSGPALAPMQVPESKVCRLCTLQKPAAEFKRARSLDGLTHICSLCQLVTAFPMTGIISP